MVHKVAGTDYLPANIPNCCFQTVVTLALDVLVKYFG